MFEAYSKFSVQFSFSVMSDSLRPHELQHARRSKASILLCSASFTVQLSHPYMTSCDGAAAAERSYPMPEVRSCSGEEQPHVQGVVAAQAQEDQKQLLHVQGEEGWL